METQPPPPQRTGASKSRWRTWGGGGFFPTCDYFNMYTTLVHACDFHFHFSLFTSHFNNKKVVNRKKLFFITHLGDKIRMWFLVLMWLNFLWMTLSDLALYLLLHRVIVIIQIQKTRDRHFMQGVQNTGINGDFSLSLPLSLSLSLSLMIKYNVIHLHRFSCFELDIFIYKPIWIKSCTREYKY